MSLEEQLVLDVYLRGKRAVEDPSVGMRLRSEVS